MPNLMYNKSKFILIWFFAVTIEVGVSFHSEWSADDYLSKFVIYWARFAVASIVSV